MRPDPLLDIRGMVSIQEAAVLGLESTIEVDGNNFSLTVVVIGEHKGEGSVVHVGFGRYG